MAAAGLEARGEVGGQAGELRVDVELSEDGAVGADYLGRVVWELDGGAAVHDDRLAVDDVDVPVVRHRQRVVVLAGRGLIELSCSDDGVASVAVEAVDRPTSRQQPESPDAFFVLLPICPLSEDL